MGIYVIYFFKDGDFLLLPIPWVAISACNNIAKCLKTILRVNPELGRGDYLGVVNGCASTNSQVVVAEGLNVLALFTLLQYKPQVDSLCIEYTQMWQKCVCSKDRLAAQELSDKSDMSTETSGRTQIKCYKLYKAIQN